MRTLLLSLALLGACKDASVDSGACASSFAPLASQAAPNFELEDTNSTSTSFGELVAPSDHLGRISAWYFGHST
ncbi:MAG: hypothetical protein H6740_15255 [Alphaproteobacteria bacterium]|nr:hypothetical protein [Alphaproteobacteria bacterium]